MNQQPSNTLFNTLILLSLILSGTGHIAASNLQDSIAVSREQIVIQTPEDIPTTPAVPDQEIPQLKEWRDYIAKPFSEMKDKKLKQISKELAQLPDTRSVRTFRTDFDRTMRIKAELDSYWETAKRPYDFEDVEDTKEKVFELESRVNRQQAEDIHNGLLTVLVRFRKGAITLQQIVSSFEAIIETVPKDAKGKFIRQPDTKRQLVAQFEEVISSHSESIQKRIKGNPYLESLYSGYVGGMRMNPFNTGLRGVRDQIMNQHTDLPE